MFGFHAPELLIVLVLAAVVLGPKRLPQLGGSLGRGLRDFRHGLHNVQEETGIAELTEHVRDVRDTVLSVPRDLEASARSAGSGTPQAPTAAPSTEEDSTGSPPVR